MNILVITRWFPNKCDQAKCVFTKNILDAQVNYTNYDYTLISPTPYFPKVDLPFIPEKFKKLSKLECKENGNGYDIYRPKYFKLPYPLGKGSEWYTYFKSVLSTIKREKLSFDLIHSHGIYPDGYVAMRIAEHFGVPVIIHMHDSYFKEIHQAYRQKIDRIMGYSERIIAVSEFQKNIIVDIYDEFDEKISTVYNGIDTNKFNVADHEKKDKVKLVFVGNLIDVKAVDILIHAVNLLRTDIPVFLDIYGDGKNGKEYQDLVNKLDIADIIKFKGIVSNDVLAEYLPKYSYLVLPSHYETFGIVLIEAMACGIPVIATKVGAIPEIVTSDEVGILVEPNSPESLAEGIRKAIKKNWNRQKIREYAENFSIESTARKIEKIYYEILKAPEKATNHERKRKL